MLLNNKTKPLHRTLSFRHKSTVSGHDHCMSIGASDCNPTRCSQEILWQQLKQLIPLSSRKPQHQPFTLLPTNVHIPVKSRPGRCSWLVIGHSFLLMLGLFAVYM